MTITIKNASPALLKAVKSMAKLDNAKVSSRQEQDQISKVDTQNLREIYTQYKCGEIETLSFKEFDKQTQTHLKHLRAKYADLL
ncbi:hypothetical protein [Helicobacter typhlonius]|uniref:hypothetical protein n=1 Tax=Helicobacter typhlonius TaxID=76936 RepID=UPI002FDFD6DE